MSNEKKIEDYLHLYLGCECESAFIGKNQIFCGITKVIAPEGHLINSAIIQFTINGYRDTKPCSINSVKPILRPLSDMSDEDLKGFVFLFSPDEMNDEKALNEALKTIREEGIEAISFDDVESITAFEMFRYLLSKRFDLFSLIKSGVAIDASTLKTDKK